MEDARDRSRTEIQWLLRVDAFSGRKPREQSQVMPDLFQSLSEDPVHYIEAPYDEGFQFSPAELAEVQLAGARKRFDALKGSVSALARLAEEQGVTEIRTLEDLVPLLLPHTAYKSYPISFLERNRFDSL